MQIEQTIRAFIEENFLFGGQDDLGSEDSFLERGIFDSTGILELVTFLERTFDIRIEPEELVPENLDSISVIAQYLSRKLEMKASLGSQRG